MRLVLRYLVAYRRDYLLGFLCLAITNALTLAIPWLLKQAVEALGGQADAGRAGRLAILIAAVAAVLAVIRTRSRLLLLGAARRIVFDLRNDLFAHLQTLPQSFYGRHRTGAIMSRAVNDLMLVRSLFGPAMMNLLGVALLYGAGLPLMALLDPALTAVAVLPYPALLYGVFRASRTIHQRSHAAQEQLAEISNKAHESLAGYAMVRAYTREAGEIAAFDRLCRDYRALSLRLARSRGLVFGLMSGLGGVSTIAVLWLGGRHVIAGTLTLGGLVAFLSYLALLTGPTVMMGWVLGVFQRGLAAIRRVEEIRAERSDLPGDRRPAGDAPMALSGAIRIRGLRFVHPDDGRPGRPALDGVDLEVPAGATLGIVGRVGSGKTTLVQLLAAVHAAPDGAILLDGRDLNRIPTAHLRAQVVLVPQEAFLFSRTIAENIALGDPDAPRERIAAAARLAQLDRDFDALPRGLDTLVGERGVTLSGGQRQRVALARALLLEPRILVLDDALSSVDADAAEAILAGMRAVRRGRTTLIIAHRAATLAHADRVVVLDAGRVVEEGPPADLLRHDGPFARLHRRQQIERELEAL